MFESKPASTELTGGAGFTYEDTVVAYYLAHLLGGERAAAQSGVVSSVAVQQQGHGNPMDDLVVQFDDVGTSRTLSLQIKRAVTISAADKDFSAIVKAAVKTQALNTFTKETDQCGFIVEHVTDATLRTLNRLIAWAGDSLSGAEFEARFSSTGTAARAECDLRDALKPVLGAINGDDEFIFYKNFVALRFDGLEENGARRVDIINRLQDQVASKEDGQGLLLFDRLCRIAREGSANGAKWTRDKLLAKLHGVVRLRATPRLADDIQRLNAYSLEALSVVSEKVDDFHVERTDLQKIVAKQLELHRVVTIGGLPGCGKSAVLMRFAQQATANGPILFLKNDRLAGAGWTQFAASLGLSGTDAPLLLAEIGAIGTPILFIDGIDRIRPDQQGIVTDLVNAIHGNPNLSHWKVAASSRDQGLEAFRAWFPAAMYANTGIGDVIVKPFSDEEAEKLAQSKPHLRKVLFGSPAVQDIARRPFFAAVLARSVPEGTEPQTEVDLISAWWARAGHDAIADTVPQRQRALIDIAERGVRNLGKGIPTRDLRDATIAQVAALKTDQIIRDERQGAFLAFTHDIFFEWAFFRLLIELGDDWTDALVAAGEPPLLGRVVGLMAQGALTEKGRWTDGYRSLASKNLRKQWQREWLTAPPFTPAFENAKAEFTALLKSNGFSLFEKVLVWFQAQHTIPSPLVLGTIKSPVEGLDNLTLADMLGWPSDFAAWGRLIDWITDQADAIPVRLIPRVMEIFDVWQNVAADFKNPRSKNILELTNTWLLRFENGDLRDKGEDDSGKEWRFSRDDSSQLSKSLRSTLLRSARSYPEYATYLFKRTIADESRRRTIYADLIGFSPVMVSIDADLVADLAEAELLDELPEDELNRKEKEREDYYKRLAALRAIPEDQRTENQKKALRSPSLFHAIGSDRYDLDDIGIQAHNNFYFPASALHEPFKSLFAVRPDVALRLVRNISNHATKGWRQIHSINRKKMGTPVPVSVSFPWGAQQFWGGWRVYNWGMGQLAPNPLECAFLALNYWAFKQLEAGRLASDVIKDIVSGNECYAVLGIALMLTLETWETTETTVAVATCQRLWSHDIARYVQEPNKDIDLLGMGFLSRLTGEKAEAKEFLDQRKCRTREIRNLAMFFALNKDDALRENFKTALARFPDDLPYELEEQKANDAFVAHSREEAERWAGLGDRANYKQTQYDEKHVAISYESPKPLTESDEQRLAESATSLKGFNIVGWAVKSFKANAIADGMTLEHAVAHAKSVDSAGAFDAFDGGASSPQAVVASVAACVIRFGAPNSDDHDWAWGVMARTEAMTEPDDVFGGAKIAWHPKTRLVIALYHDRRSTAPRADSAARLLRLGLHPLDSVSEFAFDALFADKDEVLRWIAGQLAVNLCIVHRGEFSDGGWDWEANRKARDDSLIAALTALEANTIGAMPKLPPAWVKKAPRGRRRVSDDEWQHPDVFFDAQTASKLFSKMSLEAWMVSQTCRVLFEPFLQELVSWTTESIMPSWQAEDDRRRDDRRTDLLEWNRAFADLMARAVPYVSLEVARNSFINPFLPDDEDALCVLANFTDKLVLRHVCDAATIPANVLPILNDCASRVVQDRTFNPKGWRAGKVYGYDLPELIKALLFVNFETVAPGATRFANGDWSQIGQVMPIIDRIVRHIGWSSFVMSKFLDLCERSGRAYPVTMFGLQANAALSSIGNAEEGWIGTMLPARIAGVVQRQADWNFPLRLQDAQELLKVLDALIDLGDRRSAALEQTEAFKGIQGQASAN
ncbi:ATP-binding protein [Bradyrhizobium manausense]|uniref:NACHT domain-containing protein n=1 Tax=Bradyrhizobium manausense TaxID=989370 RepID=UPI001BA86460|nr:ATP-binding protein [Bradyrhizobium manausense]MBR0828529.1 ATP-binding protein [Bradyrhizobium manausense]